LARGYTEEEAQANVSRVQCTNGIKYYEEKYGNEIGKELFTERIDKWQKSILNNNNMDDINLKKSHSVAGGLARGLSLEQAEIHYNKTKKRLRSMNKTFSKISMKMCEMLKNYLVDDCYYAKNPHEFRVGKYRVDFYHKSTKTVVEFYGDYWHKNPKKYMAEDLHRDGRTVDDIWKKDRQREADIKKNKHVNNFFIVWESDFRKNPQKIISDIIKEIYNGSE